MDLMQVTFWQSFIHICLIVEEMLFNEFKVIIDPTHPFITEKTKNKLRPATPIFMGKIKNFVNKCFKKGHTMNILIKFH